RNHLRTAPQWDTRPGMVSVPSRKDDADTLGTRQSRASFQPLGSNSRRSSCGTRSDGDYSKPFLAVPPYVAGRGGREEARDDTSNRTTHGESWKWKRNYSRFRVACGPSGS